MKHLYAFHVSNGAPLWSYKTNGLLLSSPVVAKGMVFVGANDGHVYALQADNGNPLWQTFVSVSVAATSSIDIQLKRKALGRFHTTCHSFPEVVRSSEKEVFPSL